MSSINNPNKDDLKREGQFYPNTTGERVGSHIPGTEAHAERSELPGRASPGVRAMGYVPGTAEHERKRDFQSEMGTGLTDPTNDVRDILGSTGRGGVGNMHSGAKYDTQGTGRHTGNVPSTGAVEGTALGHGTRTGNRVSVSDKAIGTAEETLGKVMNKPGMVEKGVERQTIGKEHSNIPTTAAPRGAQSEGVQPRPQ